MNINTFGLALIELTLSLILAVLVSFVTFRLFYYFINRHYPVKPDNLAFAILSGAILFSVGHIISGIIRPMLAVIRTLEAQNHDFWFLLKNTLQYSTLFIGLGFLVSFICTITGLYLFMLLTRNINEFEEISKDNRAVGILTGVIIIVIAIFVRDSAVLLLESMVPYPDLPIRN